MLGLPYLGRLPADTIRASAPLFYLGQFMKIFPCLIVLSVLLVSSCAPQEARIKTTGSGYPEGTFMNTTVARVRNKLIAACDSHGIMVSESTDNSVVCGKEMSGGQAVLAQVMIGNSYSTTPQDKIRFTIYQLGKNVKVSGHEWIETQMAFGQMQQMELNGNNQFNGVQRMLNSLGAK